MIEFKEGDIVTADAEALVNTVNCVGVMGRGIALQFKNAFPTNFEAYARACKLQEVHPGKMFVFATHQLSNPRYIINFPTKRHWRGRSRIEDIESGLAALVEVVRSLKITSIAIPPLGSGLGGLNWPDVRKLIQGSLSDLPDVTITIFEPSADSAPRVAIKPRNIPAMTPGRAALIILIRRYLSGLMESYVSLLEIHKLMYFLQVAGEPVRLRYVKASHGPYAENLRHALLAIEGHYLSGYADGGDSPEKRLEIVPGAVKDAEAFLESKADTRACFDRVAKLVHGFESPFGLELLSTVHWVMANEGATSRDAVVAKTYEWNERKHRFTPEQIDLAMNLLSAQGWVASLSPLTVPTRA
jgi:O-acetyl-ADP-ribose deacetylase (regulator of RNase III)